MCYVLLDDGTVKKGFEIFDTPRCHLFHALSSVDKLKLRPYVYGRSEERPTLPSSEIGNFRFSYKPLRTSLMLHYEDETCSNNWSVPVQLTIIGFDDTYNRWFLQGEFCHDGKRPAMFNSHRLLDFHGYYHVGDDAQHDRGYLSVRMTA